LTVEFCKSFDWCPNLAHICDASRGFSKWDVGSVTGFAQKWCGFEFGKQKNPQSGAFGQGVCN